MNINPTDRETGKNCDHMFQMLDYNGNCTGCGNKVNIQMNALKMIQYCKDMIAQGKDGKSDVE